MKDDKIIYKYHLMHYFENVNLIMSEIFEEPYPARAAYQVVKLPKGSLVEIETIAFKE